jgi:hypothetical protein
MQHLAESDALRNSLNAGTAVASLQPHYSPKESSDEASW